MFETFAIWLVTVVLDIAGGSALGTALIVAATFAVPIALSMGVSRLLAPKMPSMGDLNDRGIMTRSPTSARQIIYGQAKVSGTVIFLATSGAKNEYLHLVVTLAGHEVQEIGEVYFNEDLVLTGSGDGYATGKYAAAGSYTGSLIHKHLGSTTQTVDSTLQSDFPVDWDSNHRLQGIAYIYCKLTFSNEIFVGGIPNISCVVKGKKVEDPRNTITVPPTLVYSANPALCLRDYLLDADLGMGMDASEIDDTSVIAAANICDGQVEIKPVTSPATYENRYECNGQAVTSSTPDSIIGQILSAMGGTIAYSGGQVVVYAAAYRSPTVTLDETNMAGGFTVSTRLSARDRVNAVKGTFISSDNQWAAADFPQITSATYLADDDGIYHWRDVILPFTTSSSAAQRIARINLRQAREEIIFTAKFNLTAMQLRAGDTVNLTNANLGFSSKVFEVIAWSLSSQGTPPTPVIELQLRETASSVYEWDVTDEVAVESAPNTTLPNPFSIDPPTNLTLTANGTTQFIQADGTVVPRIKVAWSAPTEQFVTSGGKTVIEYKEGTATTYLTWATVDGDQTLDFISSDVRIGTSYNVRLYAQSFFNTSSTYTAVSTTTPVKDTTAPSIPTGLTAVVGTGRAVSLDWNDNTEPDFSEYGIYRRTTAVTPETSITSKIAEVRASRFVDTDVTIGTTYYYWLNAYDTVENVSTFAPYVQATPSAVAASATDSTPPDQPAAFSMSSTQPGAYLSDDGTTLTRLNVSLPPMPTLGVVLNLLYKLQSGTHYLIAGQYTAGSIDAIIDDLTPGEYYTIAVQAFSAFGIGSTVRVVTGTDALAPVNTTPPDAPTALTYVRGDDAAFLRAPQTSAGDITFSIRVNWTPSSTKSVIGYEFVRTSDDTDAAANVAFAAGNFLRSSIPEQITSNPTPLSAFIRVRAVDRSGTKSAWLGDNVNVNSPTVYWGVAAGTMMNQDANAVAISGGTVTGITDIALADGGTGASTAANARINLLPAYAGNGLKTLALNSGATDVEWSAAGTGTVTSVALSGGSTGLTVSGSPITTSGTITVGGTLALANGGTGATTDSGARTALGLGTIATQAASSVTITGGTMQSVAIKTVSLKLGAVADTNVQQHKALRAFEYDTPFTGGSPTDIVYIDIDEYGFSAAPKWGLGGVYDTGIGLVYNKGASTITVAAFTVYTYNGSNLPVTTSRQMYYLVGEY